MSEKRNGKKARQDFRRGIAKTERELDEMKFLTPASVGAWTTKGLFLIAMALLEVAETIAELKEVDNDAPVGRAEDGL
jgi:hypothetical protein